MRAPALASCVAVSIAAACGSSSSSGTSPAPTGADASSPPPAGDPSGRWPDLSNTTAPGHAPAATSNAGAPTRGGTLTFTNIGAPGYWGRRLDAQPGDARCDIESRTIDLGGGGSEFCCRTKHVVTSDALTPFNEQLHMVIQGPLHVKQLAVYQPLGDDSGPWAIRSFWDKRALDQPYNLHIVGRNANDVFTGDLGEKCAVYAMQSHPFHCGPGSDPYCPGSALDYDGWPGSKLVIVVASMPYADDPSLGASCITAGQDVRQEDSPWIGVAPSELDRDGWSGYNPCHCFSNTDGQLGDGCGQINVFEVIAEASGAKYGNRDIISTGVRSYQVGSLGGATCGVSGCGISQFPAGWDLLDANALVPMKHGAVIDADNRASKEGPVWRRPLDDRFFAILLDERARTVQVAVIHPGAIPAALSGLLPALPGVVPRATIDAMLQLRLPGAP